MAQISFAGTVAEHPQIKFTADGKAVLGVSVAENHSRRDKASGEWERVGTTWRRVTLFGAKAEAAAETLTKGARVVVMGREETRDYEKKDGEKGSSLEVTADHVAVVPDTRGNAPQQPARPAVNVWEQDNTPPVF